MKIKSIVLAILTIPVFLMGAIQEISQFEGLLTHIEQNESKEILIVCDIDNTLLRSSQYLGSVAWADHVISQLVRKGVSKHDAELIENIFWKAVQPYVHVQTIDPATKDVINEIQKRNISIMALTARCPEEVRYTINQLLSLGIHLSEKQPVSTTHYIHLEKHDAFFEQGILFASPFNKKSEVLFTFLDAHAILPECIIFIDDKISHVEDLARGCQNRNIDYIGLRFSGADEHVQNFDPMICNMQWEAFPHILSDEEVKAIIQI